MGPELSLRYSPSLSAMVAKASGWRVACKAVHVGFILHGARHGVADGRVEEAEDRDDQNGQRQNGGVRHAADFPECAPTHERPRQGAAQSGEEAAQSGEENDQDDQGEQQTFVHVIEDVVTHLVAHHGHDLGQRGTLQ